MPELKYVKYFATEDLSHCPLVFRRIDSPVFFFTGGNGTGYGLVTGSED